MDSEYIILAFMLTLIGVTGIVLFNGPKTPAGDSCYCIIPSPEAGAMQGTSGILLIFGVLFIPVGILKGGLPTRRQGPGTAIVPATGRVYTPVSFSSGALFGLGLFLVFLAVDFIAIPAFLLFSSAPLLIGGVILGVIGAYCVWRGARPATTQQQ